MIEGGEPNDMLGVTKVLRVKTALQQTTFYCLRLPIHPLLEGGDQNAMLGVIKVLRVIAALQQTLVYCPLLKETNLDLLNLSCSLKIQIHTI